MVEVVTERIHTEEISTERIIEDIHGEAIERELIEIASENGKRLPPREEQPVRYATNRLALSEADEAVRSEIIAPQMRELGMRILEHPLGVIGILPGRNPDLAPVAIISHTDTIKNGDMYDGVLGVTGGLDAVRAITTDGNRPERSVMVIALTGEESAGYNFALFGSRGFFQGLTENELDARKPGEASIRDVLGPEKAEAVKRPLFGPNDDQLQPPAAIIELHVDQSGDLERKGVDLGIIEAIAAPERYQINIGSTELDPNSDSYPYERYLQLQVNGRADHSGATPMDPKRRADGLLATADTLLPILEDQSGADVSIGNIAITDESMNKIPGVTTTMLRITGTDEAGIIEKVKQLEARIQAQNQQYRHIFPSFAENPFSIETVPSDEVNTGFYKPEDFNARQTAALKIVKAVNEIASRYADQHVVGTIGTHLVQDGKIALSMDVRGIDLDSRTQAIKEIKQQCSTLPDVALGNPLPGSGEPVTLDPSLVKVALETVNAYNIGSAEVVFSAAGHDTQNAARAGIPSVMLFVPSHNGIAHNPEAYTAPEYLEKGVKALTALTSRLVNN